MGLAEVQVGETVSIGRQVDGDGCPTMGGDVVVMPIDPIGTKGDQDIRLDFPDQSNQLADGLTLVDGRSCPSR